MNNNMVKIPNLRETGQLAIYRHDPGVELGSTEKQPQLSGQASRWATYSITLLCN